MGANCHLHPGSNLPLRWAIADRGRETHASGSLIANIWEKTVVWQEDVYSAGTMAYVVAMVSLLWIADVRRQENRG